jgi:hypothetical protein
MDCYVVLCTPRNDEGGLALFSCNQKKAKETYFISFLSRRDTFPIHGGRYQIDKITLLQEVLIIDLISQ